MKDWYSVKASSGAVCYLDEGIVQRQSLMLFAA